MKKHIILLASLLILIHCACIGTSEKDPILVEAFEIHKQSVDIAAKAVEVWEKLPENDSMRLKFDSRLQEWGNDLVEVPGFHYHHDGLGHHHGRAPLKLMPDDMLLIQKEFRDSIESIYKRIQTYEANLGAE